MTTADFETDSGKRRGSGGVWFWALLMLILVVGGAFSVFAYQNEPSLTMVEALGVGFVALGAVFVGLIAAAVGIVVGLFGALIGLVAAGGALAVTAFLIGSPIIAIVLFVLLMRRPKATVQECPDTCPDPSAHEVIE